MAGYTRQSASSIQNTLDITAAPLNNEFNALQTAFGTTGHTHTGAAGEGPKIPLGTSVSGYLPVANGGSGGVNNNSATTNPTVGDDTADGYVAGSIWVNTSTGRVFICVDNSAGAAVWHSLVHINTSESAVVPDLADTNTYGLGTVNKKWANLFTSGGASMGGNLSVGGTGTFTSSVSASAFNTTSDYRAKKIMGEIERPLEKVMSVKPKTGIKHNELFERDMFVAHELQKIAHYSVTGIKDQVNEQNNPVYQTVDYGSLVPLLWAALQEATLRIEELEKRVDALN